MLQLILTHVESAAEQIAKANASRLKIVLVMILPGESKPFRSADELKAVCFLQFRCFDLL